MGTRVLLASRDDRLLGVLAEALHGEGYGCTALHAEQLESVVAQAARGAVAVVYDTLSAGISLSRVAQLLRSATSCPLVLLYPPGRARSKQRAAAMEAGADDCLCRSIPPELLVAHLRARLRGVEEHGIAPLSNDVIHVGELAVDLANRRATISGREQGLTCKEWDLLALLAANAGRSMGTCELLEKVWGYGVDCRTRTLSVHIYRLRLKLEDDPSDPRLILTVPGFGYKLGRPDDGGSPRSGKRPRASRSKGAQARTSVEARSRRQGRTRRSRASSAEPVER